MSGPSPLISRRVGEAIATAVGGALVAAAVGRPLGVAGFAGLLGGLNGAISGWRGVYRWRSPSGWLAWLLDSSWALVTTLGALVAHAVAVLRRRPDFRAELSWRRNRHVYGRGLQTRRGFLLTVGNVVSGASSRDARTAAIVDRHEDVHVWQTRWFGPLFPLVYGAWLVGGVLLGTALWLFGGRKSHQLGRTVDALAYYRNPFEWWAYSREGRWPPPRAAAGLVWRRPMTPVSRAVGEARRAR